MDQNQRPVEKSNSQEPAPMNISVSVPHPKTAMKMIPVTTKLTIFGLAIPLFLVWVANWMVFGLSVLGGTLNNLSSKSPESLEKMNFMYKLVAALGFGGGILYVILGIVVFILAIILARMAFRRWQMRGVEIGHIPLKSYLNALWVYLILVGGFQLVMLLLQFDTNLLNNLFSSLGGLLS